MEEETLYKYYVKDGKLMKESTNNYEAHDMFRNRDHFNVIIPAGELGFKYNKRIFSENMDMVNKKQIIFTRIDDDERAEEMFNKKAEEIQQHIDQLHEILGSVTIEQ